VAHDGAAGATEAVPLEAVVIVALVAELGTQLREDDPEARLSVR
jgi:hypothetical protein